MKKLIALGLMILFTIVLVGCVSGVTTGLLTTEVTTTNETTEMTTINDTIITTNPTTNEATEMTTTNHTIITTNPTTIVSTTEMTTDDSIPDVLNISFVPHMVINESVLQMIETLEELFEYEFAQQGFDITVNMSVATDYASLLEAMTSGQADVGFLFAQQYAMATLEYPDQFDVILSSARPGYEIQFNQSGEEITDTTTIINAANSSGYDATTSMTYMTNSYYSMLLVRTEDYAGYEANGLANLAGKNIGVQSPTSSSGYVYPSFLLYQNGLEFVTGTPNAANGEVQATQIGGHTNAVLALLNDEVDGVFTFFDARYITDAYASWQEANPDENIFEYTKVAALTIPIHNDLISVSNDLSEELKVAIQSAFMNVINTNDGGEILAMLFNQSSYLIANDEDYDSERAIYQFLNP